MRALEPWHLIVLLVVVLLLFGSKRLPDAARGLGRSLRIFKAETKGLREEFDAGAKGTEAHDEPVTKAPPAQPAAGPESTER